MADNQQDPVPGDRGIIDKAIAFLKLCEEVDSDNRSEALEDIRFRDGQQWPAEIQNSRQLEQRPCLTINKVDAYVTQVENQQRQQRPRIKVDPVGSEATKKVSEVIQGLIRHIENNRGGGDLAYDNGFSGAATAGVGYWRILADYCRDDSFEQDLYLAPVENQFSVYLDPNSVWPDGSDNEETLITEMMSKHAFKRQYPDADDGANFNQAGTGDSFQNWINKEQIRVAEYYRMERTKAKLVMLPTGETIWEDKIPQGLPVNLDGLPTRIAYRKQLKWYKLTALEVLERRDMPGKYIPIVPVYGKTTVIDGKRKRKGLVRNARDPARMYNFWRTAMTESVALAPKAKWLIAEGQDEGHVNEWANANISARAVLRYKPTDIEGKPTPPPQRIQPEMPPQGILVAASSIGEDLSAVLGIIDPAMRIGGNVSGKALNAERQQSDNATFNFYDNTTRSIAQTGRILLDLIPYYYSEPGRVVRILGDDGKAKNVTLNQQNPSPGPDTPGPVEQVLNDVTVGEYAVVMDTGPGFNTKRQEAVTAMLPLMEKNEMLMEKAGDLIFRNMDFPGADVIADRLAASNPLAQIDDTSEIPPAVQMKLKQQEQQIQQMGQALQAAELELKHKAGIQQMKEEGATKREMIKSTANIHIEDQENQAWMHDTAVKSQTALSVAEINAVRDLLKTSVNNRHDMQTLDKTIEAEEREVKKTAAQ